MCGAPWLMNHSLRTILDRLLPWRRRSARVTCVMLMITRVRTGRHARSTVCSVCTCVWRQCHIYSWFLFFVTGLKQQKQKLASRSMKAQKLAAASLSEKAQKLAARSEKAQNFVARSQVTCALCSVEVEGFCWVRFILPHGVFKYLETNCVSRSFSLIGRSTRFNHYL